MKKREAQVLTIQMAFHNAVLTFEKRQAIFRK